jgi:hypothetical protein
VWRETWVRDRGLGARRLQHPRPGRSDNGWVVVDVRVWYRDVRRDVQLYQIDNNGTEQSNSNVAQFIISNGVISSNPAGFAGSVTDSTGNVSFTGPCPISGNTGGATYIGQVVNDTPKFGQGTWTCTTGGVSDNWQVNGGD